MHVLIVEPSEQREQASDSILLKITLIFIRKITNKRNLRKICDGGGFFKLDDTVINP